MAIAKHTVNGDQASGWYCYQCKFTTRDVELAAEHDGMKIRTEYIFPPIPSRQHDWLAIDDNTYDGPGSPMGTGPTEQAAIDALMESIELRRV